MSSRIMFDHLYESTWVPLLKGLISLFVLAVVADPVFCTQSSSSSRYLRRSIPPTMQSFFIRMETTNEQGTSCHSIAHPQAYEPQRISYPGRRTCKLGSNLVPKESSEAHCGLQDAPWYEYKHLPYHANCADSSSTAEALPSTLSRPNLINIESSVYIVQRAQ